MKKNYYSLLFCAFFSLVLFACDSESDDISEDNTENNSDTGENGNDSGDENVIVKLYPIKETSTYGENESMITTYTYDADYRLTERTIEKAGIKDEYVYNSEGKLIRQNTFENNKLSSYVEYQYGDASMKEIHFDKTGKQLSYYTCEYGDDQQVISKVQYSAKDQMILRFEYEYDDKENLEMRKYFWTDDNGSLITANYDELSFTYDDKNGVFKYVPNINIIGSHTNNKLSETRTNISGKERYEFKTIYDIEYNEYNYPVKYSEVTDGNKTVNTFEYKVVKQ